MTINKILEDKKLYFGIGEVAQMLQVNTSKIRYWENEFPNVKPRKNRKGDRQFTKADVDVLKEIQRLTSVEGMTLDGVKKVLNSKPIRVSEKQKLVKQLEEIKSFLTQLKEKLD